MLAGCSGSDPAVDNASPATSASATDSAAESANDAASAPAAGSESGSESESESASETGSASATESKTTAASASETAPESSAASESATTAASEESSSEGSAAASGANFPDVTKVKATAGNDGTYTFDVTMTSPYDTPDRYADGWRILGPNNTVLGEMKLDHDHASEQPFTRTQVGVKIPDGVDSVMIEGHDLANGYGGKRVTVDLGR
jgi:hypothetical protein